MAESFQRKSIAGTFGFLAGMALDPLRCMLRTGTDTATALLLPTGPEVLSARKILYVTGAENVRPIYMDPATFNSVNVPVRTSRGGAPARLRRGLIGANGAEHKHYRAAFSAVTGREMMEEFSGQVATYADSWLAKLPQDQPVDLVASINDLVRYYAVAMMYKDDNPDVALEIGREITAWIELGYSAGNALIPLKIPGLPHAAYHKKGEALEARILQWAAERRGMDAKRDLMSMFVNGPDESGNPLPDSRLSGHILTLYAASFTSSVSALIWSLFLLTQFPQVAEELYAELAGSGADPRTDCNTILGLPLLDTFLKESMRLFTPVPYQVKRVKAEATPLGTRLKRNDIVIIGAWATNRLESVYEKAAQFEPERWNTTSADGFGYLTFSAGVRRCVGYGMAMVMVKLTLASIILKRRLMLVPGTRIDTFVAVTLRSRQPVRVILANRDTAFALGKVTGTVRRVCQLP